MPPDNDNKPWSDPTWDAGKAYPLVTEKAFPGEGVLRCAECGRELPVGYPFERKADSVINETPADLIVCVYCGPSRA